MKKLFLFFVIPFLFTVSAQADFIEGWSLEAGMEFPLQISGRAKVDMGYEFYGVAGIGYAPSFLTELGSSINGLMIGENTAEMFGTAIGNGFVIDLRAGWMMGDDDGFYVEGGYSYIKGGGGTTTNEVIDNASDAAASVVGTLSTTQAQQESDIDATVHALTAHIGYKQLFGNHSILFDVGLIKPISGTTNIVMDRNVFGGLTGFQADEFERLGEEYLDDAYASKIFMTTISAYYMFSF